MFTKGRQKTGGRVKGSVNKIHVDIAQRLAELKCDPIEGMARIAENPKNPIEVRFQCYKELAQYVYPKRKAIEMDLGKTTTELVKRVIGVSENDV